MKNLNPRALLIGVTDPAERVVPVYKVRIAGPMVRDKEQVAMVAAVESLPLPETDLLVGNDLGANFINAESIPFGVGGVTTRSSSKGLQDEVRKSSPADDGLIEGPRQDAKDERKTTYGRPRKKIDWPFQQRHDDDLEPEQFRKISVAGLNYETTDDSLKAYCSKYGEIVDAIVIK